MVAERLGGNGVRGEAIVVVAAWIVLSASPANASGQVVADEPTPIASPAPNTPAQETAAAPKGEAPEAPTPLVLRARGPRGKSSGETWDFAFAFESGDRLLLRFALTNLGPGERNAAAVWNWIDPSGEVVEYDNGQRESGWSLEENGRVIRIKSSSLDLRRPLLRVAMKKKRARIELALELPAAPLHAADDGGDRFELWATRAPVTGSYWTRGMTEPRQVRGEASLFYSWLQDEGRELRRVDFVSFDPRSDVYVTAILRENGRSDGWAFFPSAVSSNALTRDIVLCPGPAKSYVWPERILVHREGQAASIRVDPPFLRSDPLSALPKAIGALVGWIYKPMRLWSRATLTIDGAGPASAGVVRSTFGNPLDKAVRKRLGGDPRCRDGGAS